MILYKYLTHDGAMKVLENNSIAFSIASDFNDPFETQAGYPFNSDDILEQQIGGFQRDVKRWVWTENSGVLSLTRNPSNSLMWAHYSDSHTGVVIGFDIEIAGFCNESNCFIPAQYGSVIYTNTKPTTLLKKDRGEGICVGQTHYFPPTHFDKMSLMFLQKPMCWSYEEEVRVVKCIADRDEEGKNESGKFNLIKINDRRLYCYELPKGSVKEVYLGLRHKSLKSKKEFNKFADKIKKLHNGIKIKYMQLSKDTWDLQIKELNR
ncbi:MAG: DUF2971 domain-containing protein [Candidatus Delongbacteria bacterium]|jgi:hypothetical protein|nr:DUF2971 domain-containing protein [Candidatus Delongbacteria bacterium]